MFDATGKPPTGTLTGNLHFVGSYDQCLAIKPEKTSTNKHLSATESRYCRATFDISANLLTSVKRFIGDVVRIIFLYHAQFSVVLIFFFSFFFVVNFPLHFSTEIVHCVHCVLTRTPMGFPSLSHGVCVFRPLVKNMTSQSCFD